MQKLNTSLVDFGHVQKSRENVRINFRVGLSAHAFLLLTLLLILGRSGPEVARKCSKLT